jgi:hypothetical protein
MQEAHNEPVVAPDPAPGPVKTAGFCLDLGSGHRPITPQRDRSMKTRITEMFGIEHSISAC